MHGILRMASLALEGEMGSALKMEGMENKPPWFAQIKVIYFQKKCLGTSRNKYTSLLHVQIPTVLVLTFS